MPFAWSPWWNKALGRQPRRCRFCTSRLKLEALERRIVFAADTLATALPISFAAGPVVQVSDTLTTANQVDLYAVALHQGDRFTATINA